MNNVEESVLSRTALDHVRLKHEAGETVTLDVLRCDKKTRIPIHLKPDHYFSPMIRLAHLLEHFGFRIGQNLKSGY